MRMPAADIDQRIGGRIRELRGARGLTLDGLAKVTDVSRAMLSRIERGESSPTAQLMNKVCIGLGVTISALIAETPTVASPLARREAQPVWRDPAARYLRRNVSPPGSSIDLVEIEFPPRRSITFDNVRMPGFEQHVWVLKGRLEMETGGETFRMAEGDCLRMRLDRPIVFRNPTRRQVRYAVVINRAEGRRHRE